MDRVSPPARLLATLVFVALSTPIAARAEGFVDLRSGGSFTDDGDASASAFGTTIVSGDIDFEDSLTGGVRAGYWLDAVPWVGAAADVSYFAPDDDDGEGEFDVIPISPLLMLRVPLVISDEHPNGRVRPFAAIGPGIFVSIADIDALGFSDTTAEVGVDARAGLTLQVSSAVAVFLEYRYTWFETEFEDDVGSVPLDLEVEFSTHHVGAGLDFTF